MSTKAVDPTLVPRLRQLSAQFNAIELGRPITSTSSTSSIELGRKYNQTTGQWEESDIDPIGNHPVATVGTGAAALGGVLGHKAIMKNYGGAGGLGQAYRNVARNVGRDVAAPVKSAIKTATPYAQDALGVAKSEGGAVLKKLRKAMPFLKRVGLEGVVTRRLTELSAKVGKENVPVKASPTGQVQRPTSNVQRRTIELDRDRRDSRAGALAAAGLAGAASGSAAASITNAGGVKAITKKIKMARMAGKAGWQARGATEQVRNAIGKFIDPRRLEAQMNSRLTELAKKMPMKDEDDPKKKKKKWAEKFGKKC